MKLLLKNGHIVDSKNKIDKIASLLIDGNVISGFVNNDEPADSVIDCTGLIILPGLCDMHVHFRDPGQTHKEDIFTGAEAAAAGGVTAVACMPNTSPSIDSVETVQYITEKSALSKVKVYPVGAITKGLGGSEFTDFAALKNAGCVAVSDDGRPVKNADMMSKAIAAAEENKLMIISHCEDLDIINGGIINKGRVSAKLGVRGMARSSENYITAREILLADELGAPIHIAHVSTKEAVDIIRFAKKKGVKVTCETAPHYFTLTEEELLKQDADYRMNPPLRTPEDVAAIEQGLLDGTIDCIVTDHAPHTANEKADFVKAPNGVVGLETSFATTVTMLYHTKKMTITDIARVMCENPRRILNINDFNGLMPGSPADIAIANLNEEWLVEPEKLHSKSKNTCFKGMKLKGRIKYTIKNGEIVYADK